MEKKFIGNLTAKIRKNGNSSYLTLPKSIIDLFELKKGDELEVCISKILKRDNQEVKS